jgi:4-hydroxy-3-methylbut-2-enyl diphosphate reductase
LKIIFSSAVTSVRSSTARHSPSRSTTSRTRFSGAEAPAVTPTEATQRNFLALDATCPLVTKVHREANIHYRRGREIVLVGHAGHPEVIGTLGQLPPGAVHLVSTPQEATTFVPRDPSRLAYLTQTTLSVDDSIEIIDVLRKRSSGSRRWSMR